MRGKGENTLVFLRTFGFVILRDPNFVVLLCPLVDVLVDPLDEVQLELVLLEERLGHLLVLADAHSTSSALRHPAQVLLHPEGAGPPKVHLEELEEGSFYQRAKNTKDFVRVVQIHHFCFATAVVHDPRHFLYRQRLWLLFIFFGFQLFQLFFYFIKQAFFLFLTHTLCWHTLITTSVATRRTVTIATFLILQFFFFPS